MNIEYFEDHIAVIRELVENGTITILNIPSDFNLAHICTMALPGPKYEFLETLIGLTSHIK